MGDLNHVEINPEQIINPKASAVFVLLLAVFVYMFFALQAAEAETITVQLSVNGLTTTKTTSHRTVGELIDSLYSASDQVIAVQPERSTEIAPNLQVLVKLKPAELERQTAINLSNSRKVEEKPIIVAAVTKAPATQQSPTYSGTATWYRYGDKLTAASTQFPKGTKLRVIADASGRSVEVVINDYGPTIETGVNLDLNRPAFLKLAPLGAGRINVHYYVIK